MAGMIKRCPDCRTAVLQPHDYAGKDLDVCHDCGGLWFEKSNLDEVIARHDPATDEADYTLNLGEQQGRTDMPCPDCGRHLQAFHLLDDYHLEVDVCRACQGAWVERHELDKVAHSAMIRQALGRLGGGISWKTWIFQFLSQLPVEYNIKPRRRPWVTWTLIALNTVIFLAYFLDPTITGQVFEHFAITSAEALSGREPWTFVTHQFLHGGVMHLVANMYFLWLVGDNLEDVLGHARYLGLYLLCGVGAAVVSVLADPGSTVPSVGASGAIAGLFGMYMLWFPRASLTFMFLVFQKKLRVHWYFGIWLALNFAGMAMGGQGVDYWAHLGGFAIGAGIGFALRRRVWSANPLVAHLAGPEVKPGR